MTDLDRLAEIAAQLAGRVRDDDPEANARWLSNVLPDPADWFRLAFVLAAAIPDDQTWTELTEWCLLRIDGGVDTPNKIFRRRLELDQALRPKRWAA